MGENPIRCTTHDEKGPVLIVVTFNLIFDPQKKKMNQKLSKNLKDYILDYYNFRFHHNHS
jgi:hypothetical protein